MCIRDRFGIRLFEDPETGDSYKYEVNLAENRVDLSYTFVKIVVAELRKHASVYRKLIQIGRAHV